MKLKSYKHFLREVRNTLILMLMLNLISQIKILKKKSFSLTDKFFFTCSLLNVFNLNIHQKLLWSSNEVKQEKKNKNPNTNLILFFLFQDNKLYFMSDLSF